MSDSKASRFPDNEFDASLTPIKEATADTFSDRKPTSGGWNVARLAEWGRVDEFSDIRSYKRSKEYESRPHVARFVHDQVYYRHFEDPAGGGQNNDVITPSATAGIAAAPPVGQQQATLPTRKRAKPKGLDAWRVNPNFVGFEISPVSDYFGSIKSKPDWNPADMNGPNFSTMIISRRELEKVDRDFDLPSRYFGRTVDLFVPQSTQDVRLNRVTFGGGADFNKNRAKVVGYQDGVFKTALNITPFDKPIEDPFDQKNEHDGGPGAKGFTGHDYVPGFPDPKAVEPDIFHQGGWVFDGRQSWVAQLQDIIGIDAIENDAALLPRYKNRFDEHVGISYIRHDAHFMKKGDDD